MFNFFSKTKPTMQQQVNTQPPIKTSYSKTYTKLPQQLSHWQYQNKNFTKFKQAKYSKQRSIIVELQAYLQKNKNKLNPQQLRSILFALDKFRIYQPATKHHEQIFLAQSHLDNKPQQTLQWQLSLKTTALKLLLQSKISLMESESTLNKILTKQQRKLSFEDKINLTAKQHQTFKNQLKSLQSKHIDFQKQINKLNVQQQTFCRKIVQNQNQLKQKQTMIDNMGQQLLRQRIKNDKLEKNLQDFQRQKRKFQQLKTLNANLRAQLQLITRQYHQLQLQVQLFKRQNIQFQQKLKEQKSKNQLNDEQIREIKRNILQKQLKNQQLSKQNLYLKKNNDLLEKKIQITSKKYQQSQSINNQIIIELKDKLQQENLQKQKLQSLANLQRSNYIQLQNKFNDKLNQIKKQRTRIGQLFNQTKLKGKKNDKQIRKEKKQLKQKVNQQNKQIRILLKQLKDQQLSSSRSQQQLQQLKIQLFNLKQQYSKIMNESNLNVSVIQNKPDQENDTSSLQLTNAIKQIGGQVIQNIVSFKKKVSPETQQFKSIAPQKTQTLIYSRQGKLQVQAPDEQNYNTIVHSKQQINHIFENHQSLINKIQKIQQKHQQLNKEVNKQQPSQQALKIIFSQLAHLNSNLQILINEFVFVSKNSSEKVDHILQLLLQRDQQYDLFDQNLSKRQQQQKKQQQQQQWQQQQQQKQKQQKAMLDSSNTSYFTIYNDFGKKKKKRQNLNTTILDQIDEYLGS